MNAPEILERLSGRVRCITIGENIWIGGTSLWYYEKEVGHLICLNLDGSLNEGVTNRLKKIDGNVYCITQTGNNVWVGGDFSHYGGKEVGRLVCLNMDGSLNESVMNKLEGFDDCVYCITKINNKVLVSGDFIMYGTKKVGRYIWLDLDGSLVK